MDRSRQATTATMIGRAVVAGVAGTVITTAFQRLIEMPLTGCSDSCAPAGLAERILPIHATTPEGRQRLNYATHFALGIMWGTASGIAASSGLRGQKAVNAVFAAVYRGDIALDTALRLYQPTQWSRQDWAVDIIDKYVQAQATGAAFDRLLDPTRPTP